MSGTSGDDAPFDAVAHQGHVADDVQQLVACRLVVPHQWLGLQKAQFGGVVVWCADAVGQLVQFFLALGRLVDDNGIVQVAAADQACGQHHFHLAHEAEGACGSYLAFKVVQRFQRRELVVQHLRVEGNHGRDAELVVGQDGHDRTCSGE